MMGWAPLVFPRELQYVADGGRRENDFLYIATRDGRIYEDSNAMAKVLGIPEWHARRLFRDAKYGYKTPQQTSDALLQYAATGQVPAVCFERNGRAYQMARIENLDKEYERSKR